jgi:cytochrome c551/c552
MGKIVLFLMLIFLYADADILQKNCLSCHQKQQIPTHLIYKRYLLKYSTDERMKKAIYEYLKNPDKEHSIMPSAFFLKFPMKQSLHLSDFELEQSIEAFLRKYNVKKKLVLE